MINKVEKSSNIICRMFQEIEPCFYSYHIHQQFVILCQSSDNPQISKYLCDLLNISMGYFLNNINLYGKSDQLEKEQIHKIRIANLITSCRQEIKQKKLQGSSAFAIGYYFKNKLYCFRSEGIEIFLLDQQQYNLKALNRSYSYKQNKRNRNKNIEEGYFTLHMPNIKAQYLFQQNDFVIKPLYFQRIDINKANQKTINLRLLIGCSETFDLITPQLLFKYFFGNKQKIDCQKVKQVLEQARKQIKSVHQQDLSLICWRIPSFS